MGGLHAIREEASGEFRQLKLQTLLEHKRAVLIDAGFANAITASQVMRGGASFPMALQNCLRWLKSVLPKSDCQPQLEVTVRQLLALHSNTPTCWPLHPHFFITPHRLCLKAA